MTEMREIDQKRLDWWHLPEEYERDVLFHPDARGEPGSGAVQSVVVDLDDWHELPRMLKLLHAVEAPLMRDKYYGSFWGPFWLLVGIEAVTAAFSMSVISDDQLSAYINYLASDVELQTIVAAAKRVGAHTIEIFQMIDEKM